MKTILIIEDNNDIRESTAEILGLSGFNVLQANNGKAGIDLAFQHKPDLILCDIMMPELDGYGVLYLLGKNPETDAIPFIFLTAKAERIDFRKGMEMGADDYLTKPFDDMELLNAIESRLNKKQKQEAFYSKSLQGLENIANGNSKGAEELKGLIAHRKIRQIKKKQVLYYEGDQPQGLYLILEGAVKTIKMAEDGRELMTGLFKADNYLGINSLLMDDVFTETAEAIEDTTLCLLPKEEVVKLLNKYPEIGQQFIKLLSNNIREKEEQLIELAYKSVRKRLAQVLIRLSKQFADAHEFKISRDELAAMAGMATETVSRTLSDFKEEKLIEKKGSLINILDMNRLIKMKN
ncbi:response regulator [Mucilaginibacter polytrichastri]|uniref:Putative transcriptional regulator ycf29 n=1 Tax=Mucilaginibacter polytrichastri TaxID=1302689 RepID=A0A1Q6A0I2_9SPHI|nr:response regulator [Mucilaginibacter polytrichastri]OKS87517.1 putative transcriptional regulator ycf29 [Mucilaginibacter polytrichastri]SFS91620.1 cAMP-binding domain of CRP or a regulatory subunit of cAMP-dependent protein kinases [Mucilaginibacter polytrichastri]